MKIQFSTSNAAFEDEYMDKDVVPFYKKQEAARILRTIAVRLEEGCNHGSIIDFNGNNIGEWSL